MRRKSQGPAGPADPGTTTNTALLRPDIPAPVYGGAARRPPARLAMDKSYHRPQQPGLLPLTLHGPNRGTAHRHDADDRHHPRPDRQVEEGHLDERGQNERGVTRERDA